MRKTTDRTRARKGLRLLGRGPEFEAVLSFATLDLLVERGLATCTASDGEWRLTPAGAAALVLTGRAS